jgi:flagellar biosynthetic protein FlhB
MDEIVGLQGKSIEEIAGAGGAIVYAVAVRVALVLVVLAAVDFVYQWFRHERELRMTRREVKDEMRRQEGDPQTRQRRRQAAAARDTSRTHRIVEDASVVVTDADGVAVAIDYQPGVMSSPRVLAMGRDEAGEVIRHSAALHGVPVIERGSLATGIARHAKVGGDLPPRFFRGAAEVLAYAEQIRRKDSSSTT